MRSVMDGSFGRLAEYRAPSIIYECVCDVGRHSVRASGDTVAGGFGGERYSWAMVLNDLYELIETLQARVSEHSSALQQSEALTRYTLVDPLLRGLGWDTGDPSQVMPEYRSPAGSADYALLGRSGSPQVIVEAKKLGTQLDVKVRQQVTSYCQEEGVPFAVITDGRRWEIYDIFQPAAMKDSQVSSFDLSDRPAVTCLQALALWRSSASEGNVKVGAAPLTSAPVAEATASTPISAEPALGANGWTRLPGFSPEAGVKPSALRFPDNTVVQTGNWADFIQEIVRWLKASGELTDRELPIRLDGQKEYVINTTAGHENSFYRPVDHWFVRTNYTGGQHARNAKRIIERAGLNPNDFAVKLQ